MNSLFDSFERTCLEFAKHNDNTYEYYNNSARTDMSKVRDTLERWFYNYPEEEKKELKSRFKKDFDSSFYELFLYSIFGKFSMPFFSNSSLNMSGSILFNSSSIYFIILFVLGCF